MNSDRLREEACSTGNSTCEGQRWEQAWFAERSPGPIISIANEGQSYRKRGWRSAGVRSPKEGRWLEFGMLLQEATIEFST